MVKVKKVDKDLAEVMVHSGLADRLLMEWVSINVTLILLYSCSIN